MLVCTVKQNTWKLTQLHTRDMARLHLQTKTWPGSARTQETSNADSCDKPKTHKTDTPIVSRTSADTNKARMNRRRTKCSAKTGTAKTQKDLFIFSKTRSPPEPMHSSVFPLVPTQLTKFNSVRVSVRRC